MAEGERKTETEGERKTDESESEGFERKTGSEGEIVRGFKHRDCASDFIGLNGIGLKDSWGDRLLYSIY